MKISRLAVLLGLLLPAHARSEDATWDGREGQGRSGVMPVYVAKPLADRDLIDAVEGFVSDLMVRGDAAAAYGRVTERFDDACLGAPPPDWHQYAFYHSQCQKGPVPLPAAERKYRFLARLEDQIKFAQIRRRSLDGMYIRLALGSGLAEELSLKTDGGRVEPLGPRFMVARPSRVDHLKLVTEGPVLERYLEAARRQGAELRIVVAGLQPYAPSDRGRILQAMLWAREDSGWRLWELSLTAHQPPK